MAKKRTSAGKPGRGAKGRRRRAGKPKRTRSVQRSVRRNVKRAARGRAPRGTRAIELTLADLAHEIRTPLTGILALGELLAASGLDERERGWALAIKGTAEHLSMLTSLIVDAARAEVRGLVLRRELIRPRQLAQALAASLAARAEAKGLEAHVDISDALPEAVIGDPLRLRAALENLIDNAVKFTEHGRVSLAVSSEPAKHGKARLIFTVTDSGIGLSVREIKRLFRPFAQASERVARRFGGAGLGLTLVKRFARAMGGDLAVVSEPGAGSRFTLAVTLDQVADVASVAEGDAMRGASVQGLSILCVEDNPYGRVLLNTILSELGHRADFVATGAAAITAVAQGNYDVVLMDVTLPDIDGIEATRRIRALAGDAAKVPVIGLSGRANAADEAAGRVAGMSGYLTKPLSPSALTQALVVARS
jgi:two-component system, sensor histidine kinase